MHVFPTCWFRIIPEGAAPEEGLGRTGGALLVN